MLPTRCFRCFVGSVALGTAMLLAVFWFGPVGLVLVLSIGLPALLTLIFYWSDLEARKGRGRNTLKDKGL